LKILSNILNFFPAVLQGVVIVEQVVGSALPGTAKKDLVLGAIQTAAQIGEQVDNKTVQSISVLIDNLVSALNKSAILGFGKAPAAPPEGARELHTSSPQVQVRPYYTPPSSVVK
jgi:hypothetical protein